jgi:hypothetical protein
MRFALALFVAVVCSGAFASEPGSPLDCSDMVFLVPGLGCTPLAPFPRPDSRFIGRGQNMAIDNDGYVYVGLEAPTGAPNGIEIQRSRDGGQTVEAVARLVPRFAPQGSDSVRFINNRDSGFANGSNQPNDNRILFDPIGGRLLVWLVSECNGACPCGSICYGDGYGGRWIAAIEGLTTTFDVLQSFTPQPALGFHVPTRPEGMAGADSFDTYWGNLTKPLDFTQAHPLACDYPAAAPHVGDYLSVADTVPTPAPGQGVYYITSAIYQGATRYGRKTTAGHLSGRDPALLPACEER